MDSDRLKKWLIDAAPLHIWAIGFALVGPWAWRMFSIDLEARDNGRIRRFYRIDVGVNLFGEWCVKMQFGRIGSAGRIREFIVADKLAARAMVRACLRRRSSAPRRIGVGYVVREIFDADGWTN